MFQQTICLVVRGEEVLLGIKNTGFDGGLGIGRWNGYGGHIESGETIRRTSVRETEEESTLITREEDLIPACHLIFVFAGKPKVECWIFIAKEWQGEPKDTKEMRSHAWFHCGCLPYVDEKGNLTMWPADRFWMPQVIRGAKLNGKIYFDERGNEVLRVELKEVESLDF